MPAFFAHARGAVAMVASGNSDVVPFSVSLNTNPKLGTTRTGTSSVLDVKSIVTQAGIVREGNFQLLHTIDETFYLYVFGDRIDEIRLAGVAFAKLCQTDDSESKTGMQRILDAYEDSRVARRRILLDLSLGPTVFKSILGGMSLEVMDPETNLGQWALRLKGFPAKVRP